MYQILDYIQLKNGLDKIIINRDDAAGFRVDSTFTHKQHSVLQNKSKPELTTRTDFVNRYSSVLQTTSYLLMATENTPVVCIGVVKPQKVIPKHPGQHSADLKYQLMAPWMKAPAYKKFSFNGLKGIYSKDRYVQLCQQGIVVGAT